MFTLHILSFISQSLLTKSCVQLTGTCSTLHWCLHVKPRMQSIQQEPVFLIENGEDLVTTYLCSCHLVPRSPEWCSRLYSTMWADGKKSHPLPAWITNNSWQLFSQVYLSGRKKKRKRCHEVFVIYAGSQRKERIIFHVLHMVNTGLSDGFSEFSSSGLSCYPPQLPAIWPNTTPGSLNGKMGFSPLSDGTDKYFVWNFLTRHVFWGEQ